MTDTMERLVDAAVALHEAPAIGECETMKMERERAQAREEFADAFVAAVQEVLAFGFRGGARV